MSKRDTKKISKRGIQAHTWRTDELKPAKRTKRKYKRRERQDGKKEIRNDSRVQSRKG